MRNLIDMVDNSVQDPETGKLIAEKLDLKVVLAMQINRLVGISSSLSACDSLQEYKLAVNTFQNCIGAAENLVWSHLDKKYMAAKAKIKAIKTIPFDEKHKGWIANLNTFDYLQEEAYHRRRLNYNLNIQANKANLLFREFMAWTARADMGLGIEKEKGGE